MRNARVGYVFPANSLPVLRYRVQRARIPCRKNRQIRLHGQCIQKKDRDTPVFFLVEHPETYPNLAIMVGNLAPHYAPSSIGCRHCLLAKYYKKDIFRFWMLELNHRKTILLILYNIG